MSETRKILVAIDGSDSTMNALDRIAALHGDDNSTVRLFHVVGPIPPALLEHGGADTPTAEERLDARYEAAQAEWFEKQRTAALPMVEAARDRLVAAGLSADRVSGHIADSLPEDRLADLIVEEAREAGCDAIVLGQSSYGWLREKFHKHAADSVRSHAHDLKVVVVE